MLSTATPDPVPLSIMTPSSSLPYVIITSADKLNGYTAVKNFATHFTNISPSNYHDSSMMTNLMADTEIGGRSQIYLHPSDNNTTKSSSPSSSLYRLHCTVTDPESQFALLAKELGCILHTIPPDLMQSPSHWESIFSHVTQDDQDNNSLLNNNDDITIAPMYLVWIPDMHPNAYRDLEVALHAIYHHPNYTHTVLWSRHGVNGINTDDLTTFTWYHDLEQVALAYEKQHPSTMTILRLGFGLERLLDLVPDIEDELAIRVPLGDSGILFPISLHDAVWACHTIFTASQQGHLNGNKYGYKPIMTLTSTNSINGSQLALSASSALGISISYQSITRDKFRDLLLSLENMTPHLVLVLLDIFECAQRPTSACHIPATIDDITTLLPNGRKLKDPNWFFNKYRDAFAPGGVDR